MYMEVNKVSECKAKIQQIKVDQCMYKIFYLCLTVTHHETTNFLKVMIKIYY